VAGGAPIGAHRATVGAGIVVLDACLRLRHDATGSTDGGPVVDPRERDRVEGRTEPAAEGRVARGFLETT
jgi:hypothetical protein